MFWQSVWGGLAELLHWQVWVSLFFFHALQLAWFLGIGMLVSNSESGVRQTAGCLTHAIGGTIFQSLLLGAVVLFLTPLMLGGDQAMPLGFFSTFAWPIIKACLLALVVTFAITFIPVIGGFIHSTPGVDTFIQGMIIFRIFSAWVIESHLERAEIHVANLYPGFWASVGYLALSIALIYACLLGLTALGITLSKNRYSGDGAPSFFLAMAAINIVGILPLFMYANHVTLAIRSVIQ